VSTSQASGGPVGQRHPQEVIRLSHRGGPPQGARAHPVALAEGDVEAAQAFEAAREGDVGHRERGLGEEALGEQQAVGLRELDGRDAKLAPQRPPEVPLAHAQVRGQVRHAPAVQRARGDPLRGRGREA
jgi:hypothetical protein